MDEFKDHMKNEHHLVKREGPTIQLISRIPCSIPGCSKTFVSVELLMECDL